MNNRTQQRFDRSIREAVAATKAAEAARPRTPKRIPRELFAEPKGERLQLMLCSQTGATVAVSWNHPDAVAWRARRRSPSSGTTPTGEDR